MIYIPNRTPEVVYIQYIEIEQLSLLPCTKMVDQQQQQQQKLEK